MHGCAAPPSAGNIQITLPKYLDIDVGSASHCLQFSVISGFVHEVFNVLDASVVQLTVYILVRVSAPVDVPQFHCEPSYIVSINTEPSSLPSL